MKSEVYSGYTFYEESKLWYSIHLKGTGLLSGLIPKEGLLVPYLELTSEMTFSRQAMVISIGPLQRKLMLKNIIEWYLILLGAVLIALGLCSLKLGWKFKSFRQTEETQFQPETGKESIRIEYVGTNPETFHLKAEGLDDEETDEFVRVQRTSTGFKPAFVKYARKNSDAMDVLSRSEFNLLPETNKERTG